jgi:3'-phosphoadenosine 5'-phosphosulfate sulfotransferase (PAPS reductase)/FAD synthetase
LIFPLKQFQADVQEHLEKIIESNQSQVVLATAWLVSDNVLVDLFLNHTNFKPTIVAVDTLHLFPETLQVAGEVQKKYGFKAANYKPIGVQNREEFIAKYGRHEFLSAADFDKHSKVDPLKQAFDDFDKAACITGRRADQGNARVDLDVWEADINTFNPLANWSWDEFSAYVLQNNVPFNPLHRVLNISEEPVPAILRDSYMDFKQIQLPLPYFAYSEDHINSLGPQVYVWKSFGDFHTSVPVKYHESEREGRFVSRRQTECGIPNRIKEAEQVYGTSSLEHPAVSHLLTENVKYNIGGPVFTIDLPRRDWVSCKTPREVRAKFKALKSRKNLIAFQCRNPLHRAHVSMLLKVSETQDAEVLVHPVVGPTKDDDIPAIVRKKTYDALEPVLNHVFFEYLPYNMMVGGPREALQHAIVREN